MPQLLHCDVARKAGSLVWLCYNLDSGNPARRSPMKRWFLASDTFVCLLQSAFHLWSADKWAPAVTEPGMWTCVCVCASVWLLARSRSCTHSKAVPQELTWSALAAEGRGIPSCGAQCSRARSSSRPTAGLESILISAFSLHLICQLHHCPR